VATQKHRRKGTEASQRNCNSTEILFWSRIHLISNFAMKVGKYSLFLSSLTRLSSQGSLKGIISLFFFYLNVKADMLITCPCVETVRNDHGDKWQTSL
jgi:hypothetical protein